MIPRAQALSLLLLSPLGRRWSHVRQVAARAHELAGAVATEDRETLIVAAWLHDIGYAPEVAQTGFHPLDGARFLAGAGWPPVVVQLVAHHTGAWSEAAERGLEDELFVFTQPPTHLLDALTAADMTVGPDGSRLSAEERLAEILVRYNVDDPVHRAVTRSAPELMNAVYRTNERLRQTPPS